MYPAVDSKARSDSARFRHMASSSRRLQIARPTWGDSCGTLGYGFDGFYSSSGMLLPQISSHDTRLVLCGTRHGSLQLTRSISGKETTPLDETQPIWTTIMDPANMGNKEDLNVPQEGRERVSKELLLFPCKLLRPCHRGHVSLAGFQGGETLLQALELASLLEKASTKG